MLSNENPEVSKISDLITYDYEDLYCAKQPSDLQVEVDEPLLAEEVYDVLRTITDPEHLNLTLGELRVVRLEDICVNLAERQVQVQVTPTVPHCSMAMMIGLLVKTRLLYCLPSTLATCVEIKAGTHDQADSVNKQLQDKERVAAALENPNLVNALKDNLCNYAGLTADFLTI